MDSDLLLTVVRVIVLGGIITGGVFGLILLVWGTYMSDAPERSYKKQLARVASPRYQIPKLRLLTDGIDKRLEIDYGDGRGWVCVKDGDFTECLTPYKTQVYNTDAEEAYKAVLHEIEFWKSRESKREVGWRVEKETEPPPIVLREPRVLRGANMFKRER